jgi:hypothetical protein
MASENDERWIALERKYEALVQKVKEDEQIILKLREQNQQLRGGGK